MVSICVSHYVHHVSNHKMTQVYNNLRRDRNSRTASHLQVVFEAWFVGSKFRIAVPFILILKSSFFQPLFTVYTVYTYEGKRAWFWPFRLNVTELALILFSNETLWVGAFSATSHIKQQPTVTAESLAAQPQPHKTAEPARGLRWFNHGNFRPSWSCLGDDVFHGSW